jgi:hypothetical protein
VQRYLGLIQNLSPFAPPCMLHHPFAAGSLDLIFGFHQPFDHGCCSPQYLLFESCFLSDDLNFELSLMRKCKPHNSSGSAASFLLLSHISGLFFLLIAFLAMPIFLFHASICVRWSFVEILAAVLGKRC